MARFIQTGRTAGNSANNGEQRPGGLQNGRLSRRERRTVERETSPPNRSRSARGRGNSSNRGDPRRQNTPEVIPPSGRQGEVQEVQDPAQVEAPVPAVRAPPPLRQPGQIRNPALAAAENAGQNNRVVARGLAEADSLLRELENLDRRRQREVRRGANPLMIRPISPNRDPSQGPPRDRRPLNVNPDPILELTYQLSGLTAELRNTRVTMEALSNTIFENTEYLTELLESNQEIIDEINDREDD